MSEKRFYTRVAVADPGFPRRVAQTYYIGLNFPENCNLHI